jgi:hypothetical protein
MLACILGSRKKESDMCTGRQAYTAERLTSIGLCTRKLEKGRRHVYLETGIAAERQAYIGQYIRKQETGKGQPRES